MVVQLGERVVVRPGPQHTRLDDEYSVEVVLDLGGVLRGHGDPLRRVPVRRRECEPRRTQAHVGSAAPAVPSDVELEAAGRLRQQGDGEPGLVLLAIRVRIVPFGDRESLGGEADPASIVVGDMNGRGRLSVAERCCYGHAFAVTLIDEVIDRLERERGERRTGAGGDGQREGRDGLVVDIARGGVARRADRNRDVRVDDRRPGAQLRHDRERLGVAILRDRAVAEDAHGDWRIDIGDRGDALRVNDPHCRRGAAQRHLEGFVALDCAVRDRLHRKRGAGLSRRDRQRLRVGGVVARSLRRAVGRRRGDHHVAAMGGVEADREGRELALRHADVVDRQLVVVIRNRAAGGQPGIAVREQRVDRRGQPQHDRLVELDSLIAVHGDGHGLLGRSGREGERPGGQGDIVRAGLGRAQTEVLVLHSRSGAALG